MDNLINDLTIPEKFKAKDGSINAKALLKSYLELEKKLGTQDFPASATDYKITCHHNALASDEEVNQKLFDLGFTNAQAQAVYDLAAERILPIIQDLAADYEADKQKEALIRQFGSPEHWDEVRRQLTMWATKKMSQKTFSTH